MGEALEIGGAEGYVRPFLDQGPSIHALVEGWMQKSGGRALAANALAARILGQLGRPDARNSSKSSAPALNKRERQILQLIDQGLSNAQVGARCFLSPGTVKWYLQNLYEKFGVNNRTGLLRVIRQQGVAL